MNKGKKSSIESLFYNNKFLMVFSVVVAILLWASVKIFWTFTAVSARWDCAVRVKIRALRVLR